jgi:hypothetical protein
MGIEFVKDEADKKMAAGVYDPLTVRNKDPEKHYRWLRKEKMNMSRKTEFLKYKPVEAREEASVCGENTPLKAGANVATTVEVGDLILAEIPKELHEEYRKRNKQKIDALATGVTASFKAALGGRGYKEHKDVPGYVGSVTQGEIDDND